MLQRTLPAGFIAPCLPTKTDKLPSGSQWLHEIKHDGFRVIARKDGPRVRLYSRPVNDLTRRFPLIVALALLARSDAQNRFATQSAKSGGADRGRATIYVRSSSKSRHEFRRLEHAGTSWSSSCQQDEEHDHGRPSR